MTTRLAAAAVVALASLTVGAIWASGAGPRGVAQRATCAPTSPRGSIVEVTLADDGPMMMGGWLRGASLVERPRRVREGWVTFVAANVGTLTHELVVLPLGSEVVGRRAVGAKGTVDESSSLGEASRSCGAGAGPGLAPGTRGWVSLRLGPGRYELVCDAPWHYASGMYAELVVAPRGV